MLRTACFVIAVSLVIASGVVSGSWRGRWSATGTFGDRLAALDLIPLKVGGWEGRDVGIDQRVIRAAGVSGGIMRRYENPRFGPVSVLLVCGRPGPTSVHTPDVCYAGAGYRATTEQAAVDVPNAADTSDDRFMVIDFEKVGTPLPDRLRVFFAWSRGSDWKASTNPRLDFAGATALYKLYLVRPLGLENVSPDKDPAIAFARQFLPGLKTHLRPA